jgi:hypothetical protein
MVCKPFIGMTTKPSALILNETGRHNLPDYELMSILMLSTILWLFIANRLLIVFPILIPV